MSKTTKTVAACTACVAALGLGAFALYINSGKKDVPNVTDIQETVTEASEDTVELPGDLA